MNSELTYQAKQAAGVCLSLCGSITDAEDFIDFPIPEYNFGISLTIRERFESAWRLCTNRDWTKICITVGAKIWRRVKKVCAGCYLQLKKAKESTVVKFFHLRL